MPRAWLIWGRPYQVGSRFSLEALRWLLIWGLPLGAGEQGQVGALQGRWERLGAALAGVMVCPSD